MMNKPKPDSIQNKLESEFPRSDEHESWLARANRSVAEAAPRAAADPHRLAYHFMAPAYWINDPNGVIQFRGEYHLFYQHHPYSAEWGPMHWGHAVSADLVHWRHLPIALAPNEPYDNGGCFSGSAVEHEDRLYLFYTGNIQTSGTKQVQNVAMSDDGVHFRKFGQNPVIPAPPAEGSPDFRDPKVWRHGDAWYMVVGTGKDGRGKIALYRSKDLLQWTFVNIAAESDGTMGWMWECPDLFPLGGKHVLVFSPMGMEGCRVAYLVGEMDYENGRFIAESSGAIDAGTDFYAPQSFQDAQGRRILIGWMNGWDTPAPTKAKDWAGAMSLPRLLTLDNGRLRMEPVPELNALRQAEHSRSGTVIKAGETRRLPELEQDTLELQVRLKTFNRGKFGIHLRCSADGKEKITVLCDPSEHKLTVIDTSGGGAARVSECRLEPDREGWVDFRLYLDRSSLEIFANGGYTALSIRLFPDPAHTGAECFAEGGDAHLQQFIYWKLQSIWSS
jgi:beta-fructofuranosidase